MTENLAHNTLGPEVKVMVQPTPNPNALKFIVNREVKASGNATFMNPEDCRHVPLAQAIFAVGAIDQLYFYQNVITVTFKVDIDLLAAEDKVTAMIVLNIPQHDPNFSTEIEKQTNRDHLPADLRKIEEILDRTIRPGLQGDGGDLEVVSYTGNQVAVRYQGACGTCPSSTMGTLMAIEGILRDEFDPEIEVVPV